MTGNLTFVIEDNALINKNISKLIGEIDGMKVMSFEKVETALGNISKKPGFIVLDHFLGRANGIDCIPIFREFLPQAKILVLSSQQDIKVFESAFTFGADNYFFKDSHEYAEMVQAIKKYIEQKNVEPHSWLFSLLVKKSRTFRKKIIYVIDDNASSTFIVEHLLSTESRDSVKAFTTSSGFWDEYQKIKPDVVILDYFLDGNITGMDLLKKIKKGSPDVMVIILSKQEDVKVATELIRNGAAYYLVKSSESLKRLKSIIDVMDK